MCPRSGEGIVGGNEALVLGVAEKLHQQGQEVEILTTCARDHRTWDNFYPEQVDVVRGVTVRRFKVNDRDVGRWLSLEIQLSQGKALTTEEQLTWLEQGVNSFPLYEYLASSLHRYDFVICTPYLFPVSIWSAMIAGSKAVLLPCLHDESYAYLPIMRHLFRSVRGVIFNTAAERALAVRLYGTLPSGVVGMGISINDYPQLIENGHQNYLLYLGRKETGKGLERLIDYFLESKNFYISRGISGWSDLNLFIVGGGDLSDLNRPDFLGRSDICEFTALSEEEKRKMLSGAIALVNPSRNESFSIVLMEAWREGTPVLVDARCEVTREHVEASGGGLYFRDSREFGGVVNHLLSDMPLAEQMGMCGYNYVASRYSWELVMDRWNKTINFFCN